MGGPPLIRDEIDDSDIQGIVRFGYRSMTEAAYALVRVKSAAAARAWLRTAPITSAVTMSPPPSTAMHVAFTAAGLEVLGMDRTVLAGFSSEFLSGMTEASRSRRLGDIGGDAPSWWSWGGPGHVPHIVVMFFAEPRRLASFVQGSIGRAWSEAFDATRWLDTNDIGEIEPFGFADGISQPAIDWRQERDPLSPQVDYTNIVAPGEFLLGYRNEYGKYTDRPLADANAASEGLPSATDAPDKKDVGRNGSYLVMRQLRQDVRGFWQFVLRRSSDDPAMAEALAAAMVGRTMAGAPLVPVGERAIPGVGPQPDQIRRNQFTFDQDPAGVGCPFGAHVRRANPRNADYPGRPGTLGRLVSALGLGPNGFRDDLMSPVRFHRILRRGREYGPRLSPSDAREPAPRDDPERGLHFACINANISRQFEFLQNAWMMSSKFSGLSGESDPLLGNRVALPGRGVTSDFLIPNEGAPRRRVSGLPQFVAVRGGAYFFLPGLRALRYIAGAADRSG
jgi:deferrochelatase/peroxidase EfeB